MQKRNLIVVFALFSVFSCTTEKHIASREWYVFDTIDKPQNTKKILVEKFIFDNLGRTQTKLTFDENKKVVSNIEFKYSGENLSPASAKDIVTNETEEIYSLEEPNLRWLLKTDSITTCRSENAYCTYKNGLLSKVEFKTSDLKTYRVFYYKYSFSRAPYTVKKE